MRPPLAILLTLLAPLAAFAESGWVLTDADFKTSTVSLIGIDDKGVAIAAGADARTLIPYDRFLELQRPASAGESAEKFVLHLANGDILRGEPVGAARESIQWKSAALGDLQVSLRDVRALVRAGNTPDGIDDEHKDDIVVMTNGDKVSGIVSTVGAYKVTLSGSDASVPLQNVDHIFFAAPAQKRKTPARAFRVRLVDGSIFTAPELRVGDDKLTLKLPAGPRQIDLASIVLIEQLNGPVSWLSSRPADKIEQTPFLDENFPPRMDRTVEDKPIRFGKTVFPRGVGVHSRNVLEYELDGSWAAFRTQYAIDEGRNEKADVTVRIKLDGQIVHEQKNVRAGKLSEVILIPLKDAKRLTLETDFGEGIHSQDRLNWIAPALLRKMPAPPAPPPPPPPPAPPPPPLPPVTQPSATAPSEPAAPTAAPPTTAPTTTPTPYDRPHP